MGLHPHLYTDPPAPLLLFYSEGGVHIWPGVLNVARVLGTRVTAPGSLYGCNYSWAVALMLWMVILIMLCRVHAALWGPLLHSFSLAVS